MCVQETHVTDAAEASSWFSSSGFLTVTVPGTAHSRGQVLMYRPSFSFVNSWVELEGRFLMAEFSRRDSVVRIVSVYAPNWNPEHDEFFTSCLDLTDPSVPTILGGDFNAVFDRARDRRGSDPTVTVRETFVSLELRFKEFCVLDVWRHLHPDLRAYTWLKRYPMVPCPPASNLLPSRLAGFILCLPVLLFHVLSLITMPFFSASISLNLCLVALADGN